MGDSVAGDYASLGGVEIVNVARTIAYLETGLAPSTMSIKADCGCPGLFELLGCPPASGVTELTGCPPASGGYTDPATDGAPWYSADHPESAGFAGFFPVEFEGMSSTYVREVTDSIGDGGILGRGRAGHRVLTWSGFLFGSSCCSVAYGLRWLTNTLRASSQCRDCNGDDLELLVCCPAVSGTGPQPEAFRTLKNVALLEGPELVSERRTSGDCSGVSGGCGGSVIMEVEFSLAAAQPWFYKAEIPIVNCISLDNGIDLLTDETVDCPPANCADTLFDVICPVSALPPAGVYVNPCSEGAAFDRALYLTVPRSSWKEFEEAVPYITITTGGFWARNLKLGTYSSGSGDPCGDLSSNPPLCNAICDQLTIAAIPIFSTFIIDGRTHRMSVVCNDGSAFPGEPYTTGPWSWPVFDCYGFCLEVAFFDSGVSVNPAGVCVSVSMIPRSL